jgi:hypothetical protein
MIARLTGVHIPIALRVLVCALALPGYLFAEVFYLEFVRDREMKKMGGGKMDRVKGKWLGSYDILTELMDSRDNGYPGTCFCFRLKRF